MLIMARAIDILYRRIFFRIDSGIFPIRKIRAAHSNKERITIAVSSRGFGTKIADRGAKITLNVNQIKIIEKIIEKNLGSR